MIDTLFPDGVVAVMARGAMWEGPLDSQEAALVGDASAKRRREFTAGRVCAREALAELGIEAQALLADVDRVPCWPSDAVGSISHRGEHCAAAVALRAHYAGLGLDLERSTPLSEGVAKRIASDSESEHLTALPPLAGADWSLLLFSAKESLYKCYFPLARTRLGFRDVEIEFNVDRSFTGWLVRRDAPPAAGVRHFTGRFQCGGGFVATGVWLDA